MSNTKPIVILVHGVGDHDEHNFKAQCVKTLDWVSTQYANVPKFSEYCDIRSIAYDDIFDKVLANAREARASGNTFTASQVSIVNALAHYQDAIAEDNFFTENALDAYVYKTFLAGAVEAAVASRFYKIYNESLNEDGTRCSVHLICHSLGTAVMTNVLHRLYVAKDLGRDESKYLDTAHNKLSSITMLANVAPLFPRCGMAPENTAVRPTQICDVFINARHRLDPIPAVKPFAPKGEWSAAEMALYSDVEFSDIVDLVALDTSIISADEPKLNVHAVEHYLAQSLVHQNLFFNIMPADKHPTSLEMQAYASKWVANSIEGAAQALKDSLTQFDVTNGIEDDVDELKVLYKKLAVFFG